MVPAAEKLSTASEELRYMSEIPIEERWHRRRGINLPAEMCEALCG